LDLLDITLPYIKKDDPTGSGRIAYTTKDGSFNLYLSDDYIVLWINNIVIDFYGSGANVGGVTCSGICYSYDDENRKVCKKMGRVVSSNASGLVYAIED
jgi:hypothetical protein